MEIQEHISLKGKTTMRIGGTATYYAELATKQDVEEAVQFARDNALPLIPLGGGSNTIFADGEINALVVRITASHVSRLTSHVSVEAGKNLPQLINELAKEGLDLSPLTGILGTVGGAVFGNAGQGPQGVWIDSFVEKVEVYMNEQWQMLNVQECEFTYRESWFKHQLSTFNFQLSTPPIIWSTTLNIPQDDPQTIQAEINRLLQRRIDTQPHVKTAGSCFKAVGDTPAWQLIDSAGLRDTACGGVHISEKHANFLINDGEGTFEDAVQVVHLIENELSSGLEVEMRFVKEDGTLAF